jgi:hypothetical protein
MDRVAVRRSGAPAQPTTMDRVAVRRSGAPVQPATMQSNAMRRIGAHEYRMETMLTKIKDRQWALADIDWAAPGAETIDDEFRPKLKAFMADLCWIENIGARGFSALAKKAPNATLAEIYRYFHAEEQRHANAELALMKRWGMLDEAVAQGADTPVSSSA